MTHDDTSADRRIAAARTAWDAEAATFDDEPDHGLRDPAVRAAWATVLAGALPPPPGAVLDLGCGTGSLSVLLAERGYAVTGADVSPRMLERARAKADLAGLRVAFAQMDAAFPAFAPARFDALVCRHLLWALPDPAAVLARWASLLKPGGRLLLVEGVWHTGVGLLAADVLAALPASLAAVHVEDLSAQPDLWGGPVADERYAVRATRA